MLNPCQPGSKQYGNTLAEYAIIIGLIGVASIGALTVLGQSVNGNYDNLSKGNSAKAMQAMSQMNFTAASGSPGQSSASGPQAQYNVGSGSFQLADTSSGGTNVTSIEGNVQAVIGQGVQTAATMEKLADQVTDPKLKDWYRKTSDMVFKLAGSQAAYEIGVNPNLAFATSLIPTGDQGKVTIADAVLSIDEWQEQLEAQLKELEANKTASAHDIQQARDLLGDVVQTNSAQYSGVIQSTNTSDAKLYDPNVNQVKKAAEVALETGVLTTDEALGTSVISGVEMDQKASTP